MILIYLKCFYSTIAMLVRGICKIVPPIFGVLVDNPASGNNIL